MKRPRSLQWRLSLWLGLGLTVLWALAAVVTAQMLRHEMDEVFDSALEETAQRILPLAAIEIIGRDADDTEQRVATLRQHDEYFTYVVRDAAGKVLLRSHSADLAAFPPFSGMGFATTPTHRLYSDATLQQNLTITIAEPLSHRRMTAGRLLLGLSLPLAVIVPLGLIGIWVIVRLSMTPVRTFRSQIEARGGGDLTPIDAEDLPSEIGPVAKAVNHLLDRLTRTLQAERSLAAKSAHELRTPVAAALAQAQRMIAQAPDDATRERAEDMQIALRRLSRLTEKLMQLARAEGGRLLAEAPVEIGAILRMVGRDGRAHRPDASGCADIRKHRRRCLRHSGPKPDRKRPQAWRAGRAGRRRFVGRRLSARHERRPGRAFRSACAAERALRARSGPGAGGWPGARHRPDHRRRNKWTDRAPITRERQN